MACSKTTLSLLALGMLAGCSADGTATADGGLDAARPAPDASVTRDASQIHSGGDAQTPMGTDAGCGLLMPPATSGTCCTSCTPGSGNCQPNGCYNGWWCDNDSDQCRCVSPPTPSDCATGLPMPGTWPSTTGALACSTPATFDESTGTGQCGRWRWSVKTGVDTDASSIDTTPVVTTIADLIALSPPSTLQYGTPRQPPTETTVYELVNIHVSDVGRSADSDYHMIVDDGAGNTMIIEVPFPECVVSGGVLGCNITHARKQVDDALGPVGSGHPVDQTATVIGVGFFDFVHGQNGVAPNGIELHPVLAICFGSDCTPN